MTPRCSLEEGPYVSVHPAPGNEAVWNRTERPEHHVVSQELYRQLVRDMRDEPLTSSNTASRGKPWQALEASILCDLSLQI